MTQEIIEMARQAGFKVDPSRDGPDSDYVRGVGINLVCFVKLAAAKERERLAAIAEKNGNEILAIQLRGEV